MPPCGSVITDVEDVREQLSLPSHLPPSEVVRQAFALMKLDLPENRSVGYAARRMRMHLESRAKEEEEDEDEDEEEEEDTSYLVKLCESELHKEADRTDTTEQLVMEARRLLSLPRDQMADECFRTIKNGQADLQTVGQACRILHILSIRDETGIKIYDDGVVDAIVSVMEAAERDPSVLLSACLLLRSIAALLDKPDIEKLSQRLIRAMNDHKEHEEFQLVAMDLISRMVHDEDSALIMGEIPGITCLISSMEHHANSRAIQEKGCGALATLISHDGQSLGCFAAEQGIDAVVAAAFKFQDSPSMYAAAAKCIFFLSSATFYLNRVASCGGSAIVLRAMRLNMNNPEALEDACGAVAILSENDRNRKIILERDGITAVTNVMKMYCTQPILGLVALKAIRNLAVTQEQANKFFQMGGLQAIVQIMLCVRGYIEIEWEACNTLRVNSYFAGSLLATTGALGAALDAMKRYPNNPDMQIVVCKIMGHVLSDPECLERIGDEGGAEVVMQALETHLENPDVVVWGCHTMLGLSVRLTPKISFMHSQRWSELLVKAKAKHAKHKEIPWICQAAIKAREGKRLSPEEMLRFFEIQGFQVDLSNMGLEDMDLNSSEQRKFLMRKRSKKQGAQAQPAENIRDILNDDEIQRIVASIEGDEKGVEKNNHKKKNKKKSSTAASQEQRPGKDEGIAASQGQSQGKGEINKGQHNCVEDSIDDQEERMRGLRIDAASAAAGVKSKSKRKKSKAKAKGRAEGDSRCDMQGKLADCGRIWIQQGNEGVDHAAGGCGGMIKGMVEVEEFGRKLIKSSREWEKNAAGGLRGTKIHEEIEEEQGQLTGSSVTIFWSP
ncbi:hypothetical protein GUITHDRAFT_131762 [Guillardia theta CCMP2712]|uniref:LRRK2 ARM repeat domain-containing protein n=2 Tax=Guillardia theta TaxID=55529 RepID=L1K2C1_GUITC|nr:hypothetical protein GUITHDRAFT_131762 [Guillardia theta CCMP2712]EKX54729.1 hypothetical protein GUITHDRAFT_131762 [Guillardia theta CCMP2712]|eukprot:XP_005841709.1 hypothetical protein GUITHDRAFT_131762 [Guillardia theta CCMP2712]